MNLCFYVLLMNVIFCLTNHCLILIRKFDSRLGKITIVLMTLTFGHFLIKSFSTSSTSTSSSSSTPSSVKNF